LQPTASSLRYAVLRCGFRQRLTPGVDMTSDVKSSSEICYVIIFIAAQLVIGSGGASQTRRLILRLAVGWRPPDWRPSGACRSLGTRMPAGLFTLSRVAPLRGCVSADARWRTFSVVGYMTICPSALGGHRHLLGHSPHKAREFPGNGHDHLGRVCATRDYASIALTKPDLGFPADVLDDLRWLFEPHLQVAADLRRIALRPGPFDQGVSGRGVASFRDRPLPAALTAGIF
jgi:hypothetical protein